MDFLFYKFGIIPNLLFFLDAMSHKMTIGGGFTLFRFFLKYWGLIQHAVKTAAKPGVTSGLHLARLSPDL